MPEIYRGSKSQEFSNPFRRINAQIEERLKTQATPQETQRLDAALSDARQPQHRSTVREAYREIGLGFALLSMQLGKTLETHVRGKIGRFGNKMFNAPLSLQMTNEVVNVAKSTEEEERDTKLQEIAQRYGIDSVSVNVVQHPDFIRRIITSASLNTTIYWLPRQVLGWGAYGMFLTSPVFRELVDQNPGAITALAAGTLLAGALARMRVDYKVLKDVGYNADIVETTAGLLKGTVSDKKDLEVNPRAGFLGAPLDIAISSLPPYAIAWFTNPPYSIPAYLLAIYVDQVVFATTHGIMGAGIKLKRKIHA